MNTNLENSEKLEKIEASALEENNEITPIEQNERLEESVELVNEPQMEMSTCTCMGGCGSNFSVTNDCTCMGGCGSNYRK